VSAKAGAVEENGRDGAAVASQDLVRQPRSGGRRGLEEFGADEIREIGAGAPTEPSGADEADAPIARDADDFAASRRDDFPVDGKTSVEPEFGDLDIAARVARIRPHE